MKLNLFFAKFFGTMSLILICKICFGSENSVDDTSVLEYDAYLARINTFSIAEGAGSYGSYGIQTGIGAQILDDSNAIDNEQFETLKIDNSKKYLPKVTFAKGFSLPINVGVGFGMIGGDKAAHQWSGYGQWTLFQAIRWPSIGMRYTFSKISGLKNYVVKSQGPELLLSFGFFRYFEAFYSIRYQLNQVEYESEELTRREKFNETMTGYGIGITIVPPFTTLAVQTLSSQNGERSYFAKIGYIL